MIELIRNDGRLEVADTLPVVALRDLVFFPYMVLPLLIGRPASLAALRAAREGDGLLVLVTQREIEVDEPSPGDLHSVATVARAVQTDELDDGTCRVVLEGLGRVRIASVDGGGAAGPLIARLAPHAAPDSDAGGATDAMATARMRVVAKRFTDYCALHERVASELPASVLGGDDLARRAHLIAGHLLVPPAEKQPLLESPDTGVFASRLETLLDRELELLRIEADLDRQLRSSALLDRDANGFDEQVRALQRELRDGAGSEEVAELEAALAGITLPEGVQTRVTRELARLARLGPVTPEAAVIRTWIDWILALPWDRASTDVTDVARAEAILDEAHHGLGEVKERILDHIAVLSGVGTLQGPILCLVGPPGVGKTSLGRSVARALGREFVHISLGGVRDEAEIRGHRRTYVGALPGRIVQGMRRSGTVNPVFLLDEIDKLARDGHGDPGAALLEVLDPEQNRAFTDHYLEVDYDLSQILFVTTANTLAGIPEALRDRMEVIRLPGYLDTEKRVIVRRFLWPRQAARHGLDPSAVLVDDSAVGSIIRDYTREAGVRELDRRVARIARKLARERAEGRPLPATVGTEQLRSLLGPPPYLPPDAVDDRERVGIATGLAWTPAGGEVLDVEVSAVPGSGEVRLTGTLGDVMKESAMAALTYARARAESLGLDQRFHQHIDVHVHIPEGATPKDGPSAGITMAVALVSALTGIPTVDDVALTGEITLRGRVLGVGGIREKAVAALRHGIRRMVIPVANRPELELLPSEVRDGLEFIAVRSMDEVLVHALAHPPRSRPVVAPVQLPPQ